MLATLPQKPFVGVLPLTGCVLFVDHLDEGPACRHSREEAGDCVGLTIPAGTFTC